jgi:alpha-galactosidase
MMQVVFISWLAAVSSPASPVRAAETVWLHTLDLSNMRQGWGKPQVNRSIREKPLTIAGKVFPQGVGTHAHSTLWIDLAGGSERFLASVGVDDAAGDPASVTFTIYGDGRKLWESGTMKSGDAAKPVDLDVRGLNNLLLIVGNAGDGVSCDHGNWADARFLVTGTKPKTISGPREEPVILTPKPDPAPRINGPTVYGCRPGHPFLYRIPATGMRPIDFSAEKLPEGLTLDPKSGIITGKLPAPGQHAVTLKATNGQGTATRIFKIVCGDTLALTPPMGWNHWYAHYARITDKMMRGAADVMISSGMADVGYQYVNIDDCWMNAPKNSDPMRVGPLRDTDGNILPNKHFPDMKALADYIHSKGLKAGLYTSPGPFTCGGFSGSYQHEAQDAKQFADWGFDFLKYDWCSYGDVVKGDQKPETLKKPYRLMGDLLKQQQRDIVLNLCQYGMGNVWEWGAEVGGHCWRTAGDLGFELDRIFDVALKNAEHREFSRPGSWNDPDYIQIGHIGDARTGGVPIPCPLTPNEQYSFVSLWCLMAAPLFYSGDMSRLDEFTLNVLCNPEVIEVDQDPLGQSARVIQLNNEAFAMVKDLEDGSKAVGLFNRGEMPATVTATWAQLGLQGKQLARDLWRQKDLGTLDGELSTPLARHGVLMLRLRPAGLPATDAKR